MVSRHAHRPEPRGHWLLLIVVVSAVAAALVFEGWTTHEAASQPTRRPCTSPIPKAADTGKPVVRIAGGRVQTAGMPARTVALTFDGGPDPVWTPRLLGLLRAHHAHATFFLSGVEAARHPELVRRIRDAGHEIGSLTYTGSDLGSASAVRTRLELSLTQTALAGSAGTTTKLLRLPLTAQADTMCGGEWTAARRAAEQGYLLVAADRPDRKPERGVIQQYSQTDGAYSEIKKLFRNRKIEKYTTVSEGLGQAPVNTPASTVGQVQGKALLQVQSIGHAFVQAMTWVLGVAGALALLRLLLLVFFARSHVRRLHRFRPGSPWLREVNEPVTVLIPAYNEEAGIESTVRSLLASTHPQLQIIVIDDGSTDQTADLATWIDDPRVSVIRQPNAGKAAALNTGLVHAHHDIVVMVDADTVFEPDAIHQLIQPLAHPAIGAVSGNTKVGNRRRMLGRWQHLEYVFGFNLDRRMYEMLECMPTVPGAIGAFRRDAVMGVGGVSEDTLAEDTDLTMALWRGGWRVVYQESAVAWTEVPTSLRQLWRQRYRWCYGTLQAMWKHRRALREVGPAGRFARRALPYLFLFQVVLPLLAPIVDVFALYGVVFADPVESIGVWLAFLVVQLLGAGYALRLDKERLRALWAMPFQLVVYRQLMYLVIIQSVVSALFGTRLRWHRMQRSGSAGEQRIVGPAGHQSLSK
ncbi:MULTISPECIES: bifunctional polysaccharide deacetylase/glycosyltransferase family 2 protein [Streptomyces]|uniref:bifunctional polysaccharide deacetylase/glycosyltransferase family 2 protein n=1 Tax=Streptomyces TaxID=1883 RepID=UPI000F7B9597|nr:MULTISPECIES: bifunctional polysaccharide deacetylase/glycosyltransferase family 2 protein [unclassified Streptomyces]AJZ86032.2 glycosyltransferase [Streptomyces sp. AgN23]RSS35615.1 glycosyltransferase [Streptomyces sp. WAC05858]WTA87128.1 bifunctional polysaccharide deacetylase/glycosyltransferase family 2 protein [Streptomyces antimycoticus]